MGSWSVHLTKLCLVAVGWHNARAADASWLTLDGLSHGTESGPAFTPVHQFLRNPNCGVVSGRSRTSRPPSPSPPLLVMPLREQGDILTTCHLPRFLSTDSSVLNRRGRRRRRPHLHHMDWPTCRGRRLVVLLAGTPRQSVSGGTFVEDDDFGSSLEEEIEAMGGDIFFLDCRGSQHPGGPSPGTALPQTPTGDDVCEEKVDVDELWDGIVDESAYFD